MAELGMHVSDLTRYVFTIEAKPEPKVFARVLTLLARRDHVPLRASAQRINSDSLHIVIEVDSMDAHEWERFGKEVLSIPSVVSSQRSRLTKRDQLGHEASCQTTRI
jgi:acetolactate synthase regulatory subunit